MNILLTGANGFIGQHLYQQLTRAGYCVTAAVRDPDRFTLQFPGCRAAPVDYNHSLQVSDWLPMLADMDIVINAVGIIKESAGQTFETLHHLSPVALFDACEQASVKKVIQISALGSDQFAASRYHKSKALADLHLKQTDLSWVIFRPSIVFGPGANSSELLQALATLPLTPVIESGSQLIQPIHIDDLTRAVLRSIEDPTICQTAIDAVGPHPITFRDYLQCQRSWLGLGEIRTLSFSQAQIQPFMKLADRLDLGPVSQETIAMLIRGNTAPATPFSELFGFTPESVPAGLNKQPARAADRWYSGLFFFPWLLHCSIALVWIITGLCSLGLYPVSMSFEILREAGINGPVASISLFGGGILDLCLGLAMLNQRYLRAALKCQLLITFIYTLIISLLLPELWLHPFGPVTKNLPLFVTTAALLILIRRR